MKPSLSLKTLFWLTPPLLALSLYGPTLSLPFFWDDVANFQFMFGRPLAQMWIDSSGFPYYRPLTFTLWRLMQTLFGATNPAPYHALNILVLIADAWLVGLLAKRLATNVILSREAAKNLGDATLRRPFDYAEERRSAQGAAQSDTPNLTALLAAALMTIFPFAALVVPLVASLFHLFVTMVAVAACLCALEFDATKKIGWGIAAVALAALAPFAHESGLATGALIGMCMAVQISREFRELRETNFFIRVIRVISEAPFRVRGKRISALFISLSILLNLAFIPLWSRIPKARPEGGFDWVGWESVGQSIIFFLEGLTFPIQFLARPLMSLGWVDIWTVLALAAVALTVALILLRDRRWLIFAVAYCFAAALPAIAALPFSYIIVSPRLMVFTAPAAAILWSAAIVEGTRRISRANIRALAVSIAIVAAGLAPALHIVREVRLHRLTLDHLWAFVRDLQARPADDPSTEPALSLSKGSGQGLLVVNAVNWIAPVQADYALGHEGVEVMPAYLNPQLIAWVHTQTLYPVDAVTFPLIFPELEKIYFSTWGETLDWNAMAERARKADRVAIVRYADDRVEYLDVGRVAPAGGQAIVSFEDRIWLTKMEAGVNLNAIDLRLDWRVNAASGEDIFAHALDCSGAVLGLADGAGLGGTYPIWLWQAGESIQEIRHIPLANPSPDGCYIVELGLFNPLNGERTAARDASGLRLENDAVIISLQAK